MRRTESIYDMVVEALHTVLGFPVSIWGLNDVRDAFVIKAAHGLPEGYVNQTTLPRDNGSLVEYVYQNNRAVEIPDIQKDKHWVNKAEAEEMGWRSAYSMPVVFSKRVIGVLMIYSAEKLKFNQQEKRLIAYLVHQIDITERETQSRNTLSKLLNIGGQFDQLATQEGLLALLCHIVEDACEVVGADCSVIYPYDVERGEFYDVSNVAYYGLHAPLDLKDKPRKLGLGALVVEKGQIVVTNIAVDEMEEFPELLQKPEGFLAREQIKAFIGIALKLQDQVYGILYVDFRRPYDFTEDEIQIVHIFARQATLAISKATLYEQQEARIKMLKTVQDLGSRLASISSQEEHLADILHNIARNAQSVLEADLVDLYQYYEDTDQFVLPPTQVGERYDAVLISKVYHTDFVYDVIREKEPLFLATVSENERYTKVKESWPEDAPKERFVVREQVKSSAALPLLLSGKVVGVLFANYRTQQVFTDYQKEMFQLFGAQAAIAIGNARLFSDTEAQSNALKELHEIGQELVKLSETSGEGLGTILQAIAEGAKEVLHADLVDLYEYEYSRDEFILPHIQVGERRGPEVWKEKILKDDALYQVVAGMKPLYAVAAQEEDALKQPYDPRNHVPAGRFVVREGIISSASIPLVVENEVVGVMFVNYRNKQAFGSAQRYLIEALGHQAAVAIRNHRMYAIRKTLNAFGQQLSKVGVRKTEDEVLKLIHDHVGELMDTDDMFIALYDEATDIIRFGLMYRHGNQTEMPPRSGKTGDRGLTEEILFSGTSKLFETRQELIAWYKQQGRKDFSTGAPAASWLGVPMFQGEKVIGVIAVYDEERERVFNELSRQTLQTFANTAAIALDNANLYYDIYKRLNTLAEYGKELTGAFSLEEKAVFELCYQETSRLMDTQNMYIALYNKNLDEVYFGLAYLDGEPVDIEHTEGWEPRRGGEGRTEYIIKTRKAIFLPTIEASADWYKHEGRHEYIGNPLPCWMGVPMLVGDHVLGVIAVYHMAHEYVYDSDDLEMLQAIADQTALALQNLRAFKEIEALKDEQSANRSVTTLGTAIAALQHRINNSFNIIVPNISRLRKRVDLTDPETVEILDIIERNARQTSEIVAKIQEPLKEAHPTEVNLNAVLTTISNELEASWRKDSTQPFILIDRDFEENIPLIRAPVGQIAEIFQNLIENAHAAIFTEMKGGRITVQTRSEYATIMIRVIDTGPGIPPNIQERLFKKPVPSKKIESGGGGGLGLWLSALMLKSFGGNIEIEKSDGNGTTMLVQIPVSKEGVV